MLEDKRLITKLKGGDKDALRRIYQKYKENLLLIATSLLHDAGAAEDILHEVMVSFAAGAGGLELRSSLRGYLITCVVNRVRGRSRRKKLEVAQLDEIGPVASDSSRPEQLIMLDEQTQSMTDALAKIPFEQREVIVLHINGGLKFREIANIQGVSTNTVQGRYRYGLDKLRSIMNVEVKRCSA